MEICRANAKADLDPVVYKEFLREFSAADALALDWAFHEHRRRSPFFPAISEMVLLLAEYRKAEREKREMDEQRRKREELEQAKREGKTIPFAKIMSDLAGQVKRMPEPPHAARQRVSKARVALVKTPTIDLSGETPQQRESRVARERAEIQRAESEIA